MSFSSSGRRGHEVIVLGPEVISTLNEALDLLMPWLVQSRLTVLPSGNLRFDDAEPAEAVKMLRVATEQFLPPAIQESLGRRSGLGWNVFFGHVVVWWLPLRHRMGFLRALEDRAALHHVRLRIEWNQGRLVPCQRDRPGVEALYWGAGLGLAVGLIALKLWPLQSLLALVFAGAGLVAGRVAQRTLWVRSCGDPLCRHPLAHHKVCPRCGGIASKPPTVTIH